MNTRDRLDALLARRILDSRRRDGHDDPAATAGGSRLPRRALRRASARPEGQQRRAGADASRRHRRHPSRVPRRRRRHHRDEHVQRQRHLAGRLRAASRRSTRSTSPPRGWRARPPTSTRHGRPIGRDSSPDRSDRPTARCRSRPTSTTRHARDHVRPDEGRLRRSGARAHRRRRATCCWSRRSSTRSTPRRPSSRSRKSRRRKASTCR